jgi:hypothetical protein
MKAFMFLFIWGLVLGSTYLMWINFGWVIGIAWLLWGAGLVGALGMIIIQKIANIFGIQIDD